MNKCCSEKGDQCFRDAARGTLLRWGLFCFIAGSVISNIAICHIVGNGILRQHEVSSCPNSSYKLLLQP
jgi:hypothetical protein